MLKIFDASQIREIDAATIRLEPISSLNLMERASSGCARWILDHYSATKEFKIFAGPGNNGGDGLAIARLLEKNGKTVSVYLIASPNKFSVDAASNFKRLNQETKITWQLLDRSKPLPDIEKDDVIIDALFGNGLSRPLEDLAAAICDHLNRSGATILAIDMPSGLYTGINTGNSTSICLKASYTLTFQFPKLSMFFTENEQFTGKWVVLDIGLNKKETEKQPTDYFYLQKTDIRAMLKKRAKFSHKGTFGHAILFAGSYGKMGACILASRACLKSGVGLLTSHIPGCGYQIMQISVPEAMVSVDPESEISAHLPDLSKYSALGLGPGLGLSYSTSQLFYQLLVKTKIKIPMVLDADGLNILAAHPDWLHVLPENTILTPHPGEFDRLAGTSFSGLERHQKQITFSKKYKVVIVLKGAYTSITSPDGQCWFNSTGNPGMATAGSGDVLTGIVLSLLAQGYFPIQAAQMAVYLHGYAGDLASLDAGEEALTATDIINYLGKAFLNLKNEK